MNSPNLQAKLSHEGGRLAYMASSGVDDARAIEDTDLTFFSLFPTTVEPATRQAGVKVADATELVQKLKEAGVL